METRSPAAAAAGALEELAELPDRQPQGSNLKLAEVRSQGDGEGRRSKRRDGLFVSSDASPPLAEEARMKVMQAINISFGPDDPSRKELEMMLQFVQTVEDLQYFTEKYRHMLNDLAKILVDMQLKTLSAWKQRTRGLRGAVRVGMLLAGDGTTVTGGAAVTEMSQMSEMSEAERPPVEVGLLEAEEAERQHLQAEATAKRWAEKEQTLKDAMLREEAERRREEELRLEEERRRAEEEHMRAEEEAERKRLLKLEAERKAERKRLRKLERAAEKLEAISRMRGPTHPQEATGSRSSASTSTGSHGPGAVPPKSPYSGRKGRPIRPAGLEAHARAHAAERERPQYHTVELQFSDQETEGSSGESGMHDALPTHYYHGKAVAGSVGAAVEKQRRENNRAAGQPGQHWQPRQHGTALRAVPAMLNRATVPVRDVAASDAAVMKETVYTQTATTQRLVVSQVIDLEPNRAVKGTDSAAVCSGSPRVPKRVNIHLERSGYRGYHPSMIAEALATAIVPEADGGDFMPKSRVEAEAVPTSSNRRVCRRVASSRGRLQNTSAHPEPSGADCESGTQVRRSGALSVPPPPSLQRQLRRGRSAGATRVHTSSGARCRVSSAPLFRGQAAVHPRTQGGYFRPVPPDALTPSGSVDRALPRGRTGLSNAAVGSAEEVVAVSRLLPLYKWSVVEPTRSALPYVPQLAGNPHNREAASAAAAAAAAARHSYYIPNA